MRKPTLSSRRTLAFLLTGLLLSSPMFVAQPAWADRDKGGEQGRSNKHDRQADRQQSNYRDNNRGDNRGRDERRESRNDARVSVYFGDQHRTYIREYYQERYHSGHCPPGLAKRHNGCMPPGQERRWRLGRPLPRDVIYYDLPPSVVIQLGPPPPRHRYVRVAADILLIAIGTGLVVDAIDDLSDR